jgi:hypothetical protein
MGKGMNWDRAKRQDQMRADPPRSLRQGRPGDLPATPKQLAYLRTLGVEHGGGLTRMGASDLIQKAKKRG